MLDDIRAPKPVRITWLVQSPKLVPTDASKGRYRLINKKAYCNFQILANAAFRCDIGISTANDRGRPLHWQQLQATSGPTRTIRFVSIFNPWHHKDLHLTFGAAGPHRATIHVTDSGGIDDTWTWQAGAGRFVANDLHGVRVGAGGFDVNIRPGTAAPPPHAVWNVKKR